MYRARIRKWYGLAGCTWQMVYDRWQDNRGYRLGVGMIAGVDECRLSRMCLYNIKIGYHGE